jgi:hypothetical protein
MKHHFSITQSGRTGLNAEFACGNGCGWRGQIIKYGRWADAVRMRVEAIKQLKEHLSVCPKAKTLREAK